MTKQRNFKALVRARMAKTGERYATARVRVLEKAGNTGAPSDAGVIPGYGACGGEQTETSALSNVLRQAGLRGPDGLPYSEALVHGLCGGVGFLYAVFEYAGQPPMLTIVGRSRSMPDAFVAEGLARCGAAVTLHTTTSPTKARKQLDAALDAGTPALCTLDPASLPYYGLPKTWAGMGPHVVAVIGRGGPDGDDAWLDDRGARPIRVSMAELADARAGYRKAKHQLATLAGPSEAFELAEAVRDALRFTVRAYDEPPARPFASNVGTAGLRKWARLLTDPRDKKGWSQVFASGANAYVGLRRVYDCTQHDYAAPDAGRPLFATYLREAADITRLAGLRDVADDFTTAGTRWAELAAMISGCGDAAVERGCAISDRRAELLDERGREAEDEMRELWAERRALGTTCKLSEAAAEGIYAELATRVEALAELERAALDALAALVHE